MTIQGTDADCKRRAPRNIAAAFPRRKGADGKTICAFCLGPLPKGARKNQKYCSARCSDEVYVRCLPGYARQYIEERDKGVCALCGADMGRIERILGYVRRRASYVEARQVRTAMGFNTDHLWEMDHTIPVVLGGGMCGPENLRTLCVPCHKVVTRELAGRRAEQQHEPPPPEIEGQLSLFEDLP